jgi:hypothetical protein
MNPKITKEEFLELLATELPEGENKETLIAAAKKMIPSAFQQSQLAALHSCRSIQRATAAYHAFNPDAAKRALSIEILVDWLGNVGLVQYSTSLEKKLASINKIIWKYGMINPSAEYTLTGEELIALRVHSFIDPKLMW